jgi:hypothetical protein
MSKKSECLRQCEEAFPHSPIIGYVGKKTCDAVCHRQHPNGNGNGTTPKKEIIIEQTTDQRQYQHQYQLGIETQAPFTYAPVTEKVYSPIFQLYSPQASAGVDVTQEATSKIDLLLAQWQEFLARQAAEQTASQEATAVISEEEKSAQSLLGIIVVMGALGTVGYIGYKELSKIKGGKKKK